MNERIVREKTEAIDGEYRFKFTGAESTLQEAGQIPARLNR